MGQERGRRGAAWGIRCARARARHAGSGRGRARVGRCPGMGGRIRSPRDRVRGCEGLRRRRTALRRPPPLLFLPSFSAHRKGRTPALRAGPGRVLGRAPGRAGGVRRSCRGQARRGGDARRARASLARRGGARDAPRGRAAAGARAAAGRVRRGGRRAGGARAAPHGGRLPRRRRRRARPPARSRTGRCGGGRAHRAGLHPRPAQNGAREERRGRKGVGRRRALAQPSQPPFTPFTPLSHRSTATSNPPTSCSTRPAPPCSPTLASRRASTRRSRPVPPSWAPSPTWRPSARGGARTRSRPTCGRWGSRCSSARPGRILMTRQRGPWPCSYRWRTTSRHASLREAISRPSSPRLSARACARRQGSGRPRRRWRGTRL
jgi:hypothetical protein